MREAWGRAKLGDLCDVIFSGGTPSTKEKSYWDGDLAWLSSGETRSKYIKSTEKCITNIGVGNSSTKLALRDDIVIASAGQGHTRGQSSLLLIDTYINQSLIALRTGKEVLLPRYLLYYLTLNYEQLRSISDASSIRGSLTCKLLKEYVMLLPPLPTQRKIASILSAYDDLLENNLRRIKILEEMAQNLYREWFVKFRFPGYEDVKFVDSPLGKIPEGWEVKEVGDITNLYRGRSYRSSNLLTEGGLPFVNLKCIARDGGFRHEGLKHYEGNFKEKQKVSKGDIVMALTDMTQDRRVVARVGRVPTLDTEYGVISMDLLSIEPSNTDISKDYLYGYFRWSSFADNVKQHANGANVLHLSPDRVEAFELVLPPYSIRECFGKFSRVVFLQTEILSEQNKNLRQTLDLLLPKLISGEVDVSDLDIDIPEDTA